LINVFKPGRLKFSDDWDTAGNSPQRNRHNCSRMIFAVWSVSVDGIKSAL